MNEWMDGTDGSIHYLFWSLTILIKELHSFWKKDVNTYLTHTYDTSNFKSTRFYLKWLRYFKENKIIGSSGKGE